MEDGNNEEGKILSAAPEKSALKNPKNTKPKRKVNFGDGEYTEKMCPVRVDELEQDGSLKRNIVVDNLASMKQKVRDEDGTQGVSFEDMESAQKIKRQEQEKIANLRKEVGKEELVEINKAYKKEKKEKAFIHDVNSNSNQEDLALTKFLCKFIEYSIEDLAMHAMQQEPKDRAAVKKYDDATNASLLMAKEASNMEEGQFNAIVSQLNEANYLEILQNTYFDEMKNSYPNYQGDMKTRAEDMAQDVGPTVPEFAQVLSYNKQLDTLEMNVKVRLAMSDICEYCGLKKMAQSFKDKAIKVEVSKRADIMNKLKSTALVRDITKVAAPSTTPLVREGHSQGHSNSRDGQ